MRLLARARVLRNGVDYRVVRRVGKSRAIVIYVNAVPGRRRSGRPGDDGEGDRLKKITK